MAAYNVIAQYAQRSVVNTLCGALSNSNRCSVHAKRSEQYWTPYHDGSAVRVDKVGLALVPGLEERCFRG